MNKLQLNANNSISIEFVSKLLQRINIPDCQRLLDNDHVDTIYQSFKKTIDEHMEPKILSSIALALEPDDTTYIVDGNHRLHAYKKLLDNGHDLKIYVQAIKSRDHTETQQLFEYFNNSIPVSKLPEGTKRNELNKILRPIYKKYMTYIGSKKSRPRPIFTDTHTNCANRPRISRVKFEEHIANLLQRGIKSAEIAPKIMEYNDKLSHRRWSYFRITSSDSERTMSKKLEIADGYNCRLGLVFLEKNSFSKLYELFGLSTEKPLERVKVRIPSALRTRVWDKYCGCNVRKSECPFCQHEIDVFNFHCAHDIAEADGGELSIDNLYPCCATCNLAMGKHTFDKWLKKHRG